MSAFDTTLKLRIDWSEMDLFGHINNVSFFKYIQAARVHYWELCGINKLHKENNTGPTLASVSCRFLRPLHFPGEVIIRTKTGWIKNSSFQLLHTLINTQNETVAEAEDIVVFFDYNKNEKMPIPEGIKFAIQNTEGRDSE